MGELIWNCCDLAGSCLEKVEVAEETVAAKSDDGAHMEPLSPARLCGFSEVGLVGIEVVQGVSAFSILTGKLLTPSKVRGCGLDAWVEVGVAVPVAGEVLVGVDAVGRMVGTGEVAQIEALRPAGLGHLSTISSVGIEVEAVEGVLTISMLAGTIFTPPTRRECGTDVMVARGA